MALLDWLELGDAENRKFAARTWIPLLVSKTHLEVKKFGEVGHRKDVQFIESVVIFERYRTEADILGWEALNKNGYDRAWAEGEIFHPPGAFYSHTDEEIGFYPVLRKGFDTADPTEWLLAQEIELSLGLLRRDDIWVCPEENYIEVVRLHRDSDRKPESMEIRAEHLRDYLCARKAALVLASFQFRDAVEENLDDIPWSDDQERKFSHGNWKGIKRQILEGGMQVGSQTAVLHLWRESVDSSDDVPIMPHPTAEPAARSAERIIRHEGKELSYASGKIWWTQWIEPGSLSPRVGGDEIESRIHFIVENQSSETLSGKALEEYGGWLWFRPAVIPALLSHEGGVLKWYTRCTGDVGPACNRMIHFGTNSIGLVNALGYKIAYLPEWAQRIWSGYNVSPEGGLSKELHDSQNLASPARTFAPEFMLWTNLQALQQIAEQRVGRPLFTQLPNEGDFFRTVHRFFDGSFKQVCHLAKELMKIVIERMDKVTINLLLGSSVVGLDPKLREIKRLERWIDLNGEDGRKITGPLVGINDLRQGDAHTGESRALAALSIFNIPSEARDFQMMNVAVIGSVSWSLGWIAKLLDSKGALP